ncbi:hypothetical protein SI65_04650 [Aspergillus cristatus]|uniref:Plastocyanin-like domain-containing protein n=1 Tax=Aspergillus cristatus TaxID=573508 RepID=A0A1E3BFA4_ASPCR|nr:hypothetical protein SI65_04650 [Aspergillus cristatus]
MKNETSANYAMVGSMDTSLFDTLPDTLNYNVAGWLVYNSTNDNAEAKTVSDFDSVVYNDYELVPADGIKRYGDADITVTLDLTMDNLGDGANYAFFNGKSYVMPKVPVLYSAFATGSAATDAEIYGTDTNAFVLSKGDVVDIVLNNDDIGKHPFHLHGHNFQVLWCSSENEGYFDHSNVTFASVPMRRDTLVVNPMGNFVIRFVADNSGIWFFHCHIEWHMDAGLAAVMVEAPLYLQEHMTILKTITTYVMPAERSPREMPPAIRSTSTTSPARIRKWLRFRPDSRRAELWLLLSVVRRLFLGWRRLFGDKYGIAPVTAGRVAI